jgi:fructosamine-3-kinase
VEAEETPQFEEWPGFYRQIFDPICQNMDKSPLVGVKGRKLITRVRDKLERLVANDDKPRLVHWDLWGSNILARCDSDGRFRVAALLDPHAKYAHAEAELAYLELFQTVGPPFMKAYQRDRKLSEEYHRVRKPVYQLHSLLNHTYLFGERYAKPLGTALDRVAALV